MICEVGRVGHPCGNDAVATLDAICDHEHIEAGVPTCAYCLWEIGAGLGRCGPCGRAGVPTHMALIRSRPLSPA